jgi:hypothetical protein
MYRGTRILNESDYPKDNRYINNYNSFANSYYLSHYYPLIEDLTIETFFVDDLNDEVEIEIKKRGWDKVFIKKEVITLENCGVGKSIWPLTSFFEIKELYNRFNIPGKYCVRKFIDPEKFITEEERYWVLNGKVYHRKKNIPKLIIDASNRLNRLGSFYYAIDATSDFIIEVNPGESSDRHAVNSAELFASWIKKEFVGGK